MISQKEQAERLKAQLQKGSKGNKVELEMVEQAKAELAEERQKLEAASQTLIAEKGYVISVPNTEVVLFENDQFQFLYCNNVDFPKKISFLMAFKTPAHAVTGRTPITSKGYVAKVLPKEQMNILLSMIQGYQTRIKGMSERIKELEAKLAPLEYINHLIVKHKIDTGGK